ncbi:MAG: AAA family ATPase [Bacteroidota bacterium]
MTASHVTTGLFLGKFAPLHRGHQFVIETALKEVEHLIVLVYNSPEVTDVPLTVRAEWIRSLYPNVEVIEGWDGPPDTGDTPEIMAKQETYVLGVLNGRKVTHFYSSEFYGEHMSKALGAVNRLVDSKRTHVHISSTEIRNNTFVNREYVPPVVYKDLIVNAVFMGAPSTGKTTLTQRLAEEYRTVWMPEYGREYWERYQVNRRLTLEQLLEIGTGHIEREDSMMLQANRFLFTDTNAITTLLFSMDYHGTAHEQLVELAVKAEKRYDLFFLCDIDIPYDDTWERSGEVHRRVFQQQIIEDLQARQLPYITLSGNIESRMQTVRSVLARFRKFEKFTEQK